MPREIKPELLDELLSGLSKPEDLLGDGGLFRDLKKALMERALGGELTHHLGYAKGDVAGRGTGNSRNGHSSKTVLAEDGEIDRHILMLMDGKAPLKDIAAGVVKRFRHRFPDGQSALTRVGELSQRYSL